MSGHAAFVVAETALAAPPLVPEIRLHLASEITPLWQATEARLAETGTAPPYWAFAWPGGQAIARLLLDQPALVAGRRVLDFAAGNIVITETPTAGREGIWVFDGTNYGLRIRIPTGIGVKWNTAITTIGNGGNSHVSTTVTYLSNQIVQINVFTFDGQHFIDSRTRVENQAGNEVNSNLANGRGLERHKATNLGFVEDLDHFLFFLEARDFDHRTAVAFRM